MENATEQGKKMSHETAVVMYLPTDGTSVIADLAFKSPQVDLRREATLDDLYRMVCDVKSQIEAMRTVGHHFNKVREVSKAAEAERSKIHRA